LSPAARRALSIIAKGRKIPAGTLASRLIDEALEMEEDFALSKIADERFSAKPKRWLTHEEVWGTPTGRSRTTRK